MRAVSEIDPVIDEKEKTLLVDHFYLIAAFIILTFPLIGPVGNISKVNGYFMPYPASVILVSNPCINSEIRCHP